MKLFNKEAIEEVKNKAKTKVEKVKKWAQEDPEGAMYAGLGALCTLFIGGSLHSLSVANKCEKRRTDAYCKYLDRQ